jgi:hypothetical protein
MMGPLAETIWSTVPMAIARRAPALGYMLGDGAWLRAWPRAAVAVPIVALGIGLVTGLGHQPSDEIFADSMPLLAALVAVSMLGGGAGAWAWLGYVVGDLLFQRFWLAPNIVEHLVRERSGQIVVFIVLFIGIVLLPFATSQLRRETVSALPERLRGPVSEAIAQAGIGALLVMGWIITIPFAVMPFFLWRGWGGPAPAISELRQTWWLFPLVAAIFAAGRVVMEHASARRAPELPITWEVIRPPADRRRRRIGVTAGAALATVLLGGLIQTWTEAAWVFGGILIAALARSELLPRLGGLTRVVARIPAILRLVVVAAFGFAVPMVLLEQHQGVITTSSYGAMLVAIVLTAFLAAVLFPSEPTAQVEDLDPAWSTAIARATFPVAVATIVTLFLPTVASADDCSGAFDCFQNVNAGALALAAAGALGSLFWGIFKPGGTRDRKAAAGRAAADAAAADKRHAAASAPKSAAPASRPSEPPKPHPNRMVDRRPDGSRVEWTHHKDGSTTKATYGPGGRVTGHLELSPDGGTAKVYDAHHRLDHTTTRQPDGGIRITTPTRDGGNTWQSWPNNDTTVPPTETGVHRPDGSQTVTHPTDTGSESSTYDAAGNLISTTTRSPEGSSDVYYDPPP